MNSVLVLITFERNGDHLPNGGERYFMLEVDLPGVPLKGDNFHFVGMPNHADYDVVVHNVEWEVYADGKVKPFIQLSWPGILQDPSSYDTNEPGDVDCLLKAGWKEVASPYTTPR